MIKIFILFLFRDSIKFPMAIYLSPCLWTKVFKPFIEPFCFNDLEHIESVNVAQNL